MDFEKVKREIKLANSRSSGAGGQHVNKVSTKVELRLNILKSVGFDEAEKILLLQKLENRLVQGVVLQLFNQETRSQYRNKILAINQLELILKEALIVEKKRKAPKKNKAANKKRLADKKSHSDKKNNRKKVNPQGIDLFSLSF